MSWTTSQSELRTLLSDTANVRHSFRKKVFGTANASNTHFKTFEFRRVTNFNTNTDPFLGVFVNDVQVAVSTDDVETGDFILAAAPANTARVEASYYSQLFLGPDLDNFLLSATRFVAVAGEDVTTVPPLLRQSVIQYAASLAYQELAMRFARHLSEGFRLEDAPDPKQMSIVDTYLKSAKMYLDGAFRIRNDFYDNRSGQALAPGFAVIRGRVRDIVPRT